VIVIMASLFVMSACIMNLVLFSLSREVLYMTIMSPTNTCLVRWLFSSFIDNIMGVVSLGLVTFFEQKK
jgi:hypothetical protein